MASLQHRLMEPRPLKYWFKNPGKVLWYRITAYPHLNSLLFSRYTSSAPPCRLSCEYASSVLPCLSQKFLRFLGAFRLQPGIYPRKTKKCHARLTNVHGTRYAKHDEMKPWYLKFLNKCRIMRLGGEGYNYPLCTWASFTLQGGRKGRSFQTPAAHCESNSQKSRRIHFIRILLTIVYSIFYKFTRGFLFFWYDILFSIFPSCLHSVNRHTLGGKLGLIFR